MDVIVKFIPSAFKHKFTEANIRHAILNYIYDDVFADEPEKHLLIGFDNNANLLEIMYNVIDEQNLKVFHAEEIIPDMTDEEYDALDEYWTKNTPKVSGNGKSGFFAKHTGHVIFIDSLSADWLRIKATANHTTPEAIIGELVRKEIAAAV